MKNILKLMIIIFTVNISFAADINENVRNFSQLPDVYDIKVSPNGKMIGVLREINDERMVSIIELGTNKLIHNHRFIKTGQISSFQWLSDQRLLFTKSMTFSGENRLFQSGELYAVNIDGKKAIMLTGRQAKRSSVSVKDDPKKPASLYNELNEDPEHILVQFYYPSGYNPLYKMNIYDGRMERFATPPVKQPFYVSDYSGELVSVAGVNPDTFNVEIYVYNKNLPSEYFSQDSCYGVVEDCMETVGQNVTKARKLSKDWTFWKSVDFIEADGRLQLVSYNAESNLLTTIESGGEDLTGLYETNLKTGARKLLYRNKNVDIRFALTDDEGNVFGAVAMDGYPTSVFFKRENDTKDRLKLLTNVFPDSYIRGTSLTDDENVGVFVVQSDINPGIYYLFDFETKKALPIGKRWSSIDYTNLAYMEPIRFPAADGTIIHGYLTKSKKGNSADSPTIVHPHGGPEVQDLWGFDPFVQLLASEGFNVLQVNFRGSPGYGVEFSKYIRGNWDGVLNDIFDGMRYLDNEGIIDISRTCIYGGSYGGYAATQAPIMEPDLFKCAASDVGVYSLPGLYTKGDIQSSRGGKAQLDVRLGSDKQRHIEMSPYFNAEKLTVPFFIIHGKNDIRAPFEDAEKFSKKLDSLGINHKKLFVGKEGHGYFNEDIRYGNNIALLEFFNEHLN